MRLTEEQAKEFEIKVRPLIRFLNDNCHPHTHIIVDTQHAELSEGVCSFVTNDYIKD